MEHLITYDGDDAPYKRDTTGILMGTVLAILAGFAFYGIGMFFWQMVK